ncbi:TPA: hypothetical protein QCV70_002787 [Bacillus cereus]|nr:hypothetical protein [Bacillus cereus]HDR6755935.1 hypothetical protein [Bacillus cereus]
MSFVSVVVTARFISVMSDGRVQHNGEIVQEDYTKFGVLGDGKAFISITGSRSSGERIIELADKFYKEDEPLAGVAFGLQKVLTRDIPYPSHDLLNIGIGGNSEGKIILYTLSNRYTSLEDIKAYSPATGYMDFVRFGTEELQDKLNSQNVNLRDKFTGYLSQNTSVNEFKVKIQQAQKQVNDFVATLDPSVNTTTFQLLIEKP